MTADANINDLLADLYDLTGEDIGVKIGVLENATVVTKDGRTMHVAEYAMYNEFGTGRIQPRPAIRSTFDECEEEWFTLLGNLLWGGTDAERALNNVGAFAAQAIKKNIRDWSDPPNKKSTIARKNSKRDDPLVDSQAYLDNIAYEIVTGSHDDGA